MKHWRTTLSGALLGGIHAVVAVVNYHELSEFFLAWYEKRLPELFPDWYSDSKRALAIKAPEAVRQVITLGSPFTGDPRASNAWRLFEMTSGLSVDDPHWRTVLKGPINVPATSIYSRSDGIVTWQCSVERERAQAENIEVEGSHCGLGHNPAVLYAIAHRLAQPEGEWQPFRSVAMHRMLYPDPERGKQAEPSAS